MFDASIPREKEESLIYYKITLEAKVAGSKSASVEVWQNFYLEKRWCRGNIYSNIINRYNDIYGDFYFILQDNIWKEKK